MTSRVEALVKPELIEWARLNAKLSIEVVAKKLQVPPERVAAWETGTDKPTVKQLRRLGRIIHRPLAVFYLPEPPRDFDAIRDFRRVAGVEPEAESPELFLAIRMAHDRRSIALELMEELDETPETNLLKFSLDDDPESLAPSIRNHLGYDPISAKRWSTYYDAFYFWRGAVEDKGILVSQFGAVNRAEARGFSLAHLPLPVIAINRTELPQARIFSLIHEFVHLTLNQGGLCDFIERKNSRTEEQRIEIFCNRAAGAVLVPLKDLLSDANLASHRKGKDVDEHTVRALANRFRVSREVILRRMLIAGLITQSFYESKRAEYEKDFQKARGETSKIIVPPHRIALNAAGLKFADLVLRGYREQRITASDVAEYLNMRLKHLPLLEASLSRRLIQ